MPFSPRHSQLRYLQGFRKAHSAQAAGQARRNRAGEQPDVHVHGGNPRHSQLKRQSAHREGATLSSSSAQEWRGMKRRAGGGHGMPSAVTFGLTAAGQQAAATTEASVAAPAGVRGQSMVAGI